MNSPDALPRGEGNVYQDSDQQVRVDVRLERETVWLTQAQMAELFGRDLSVVSRHVRNVFADGELPAEGNMQKMHIASGDKPPALCSLDVIISVGYRVKSTRGVQFRQWATCVLGEHLGRGYTFDPGAAIAARPESKKAARTQPSFSSKHQARFDPYFPKLRYKGS
jgi:hypothetical protein